MIRDSINLGRYKFKFQTIKPDGLPEPLRNKGDYVLITCEDLEYVMGAKLEIKFENIKCAVLDYKPAFNAEYALEDLSERIRDYLKEFNLYQPLKDWLTDEYKKVIFNYYDAYEEEETENAEENN